MELAFVAEVLNHIDYVVMMMLLENPNFTHHSLAHVRILILTLFKLLDRDYTARFSILCLVDFTVGPLSDHLQNSVLVHFIAPILF